MEVFLDVLDNLVLFYIMFDIKKRFYVSHKFRETDFSMFFT